jgi:hypothetical protein
MYRESTSKIDLTISLGCVLCWCASHIVCRLYSIAVFCSMVPGWIKSVGIIHEVGKNCTLPHFEDWLMPRT